MAQPDAPSLPAHDLVVIGASAGGVETLQRVVAGLPPELPAAICIVLHLAPDSPSALPRILERAGSLPCRAAADGAELEPGTILVAPPDRHLVIEDGKVRLTVGPRENGHRPAIDTLFRSAAQERGPRVIGVVLSGTRDDGAAGLAVIKANDGATIVQDPEEALYAGMPRSALASVQVDAVVPSLLVAEAVVAMVNGDPLPPGSDPTSVEDSLAGRQNEAVTTICPECGGVLTERLEAGVTQWACRVGHRYSPESLLNAQAQDVEAAMWAAVRALEDRRLMLERMAARFASNGQERSARSVRRDAAEANQQAEIVRTALQQAAVTSLREVDEGGEPREAANGALASEEGIAS